MANEPIVLLLRPLKTPSNSSISVYRVLCRFGRQLLWIDHRRESSPCIAPKTSVCQTLAFWLPLFYWLLAVESENHSVGLLICRWDLQFLLFGSEVSLQIHFLLGIQYQTHRHFLLIYQGWLLSCRAKVNFACITSSNALRVARSSFVTLTGALSAIALILMAFFVIMPEIADLDLRSCSIVLVSSDILIDFEQ